MLTYGPRDLEARKPQVSFFRRKMSERILSDEKPKQAPPLVLECIDHRTRKGYRLWLARRGFAEGSYHAYASAGASGNPEGFLEAVLEQNPSIIKVLDHEDCGFYKANGLYSNGNAPHEAHHHNLESLGTMLHELNPNIDYRYNLLPLNKKERQNHTCEAVAILLGEPDIVKASRDRLAQLGHADNYDKIARPYLLTPDDASILDDLKISMRLHQPTHLYIFDRSEQNANDLADIARKVAPQITIETIVVNRLPEAKQFAAIS